MKTESATRQPKYILEPLEDGRVLVTLYANETEVVTEEGSRYEYDMFRVETTDRPALGSYISGNLDGWIAAAAEAERGEVAAAAREARNKLIAETDYLFESDYPISKAEKAKWAEYRQALRDVPEQPGFPYEIDWPHKPTK